MAVGEQKMKSYVEIGVEQAKNDAKFFTRIVVAGMCGATAVIAIVCFTASPESAHHLVECWRNLVGH